MGRRSDFGGFGAPLLGLRLRWYVMTASASYRGVILLADPVIGPLRRRLLTVEPSKLVQLSLELPKELERFVPVERRRARGQHRDRTRLVLDNLGCRQIAHRPKPRQTYVRVPSPV